MTTSGPVGGRPVLFLHGAMVAGWMWTQQAEDLAEFRCLLPDLPGLDRSGAEPWTSLADTADQVAGLVRAECPGVPVDVVGLSLGGLVGLHLAVRHPDIVRSLMVSGVPLGDISWPLRAANRLLSRLYTRAWGARVVARVFGMPDEESRRAFVDSATRSNAAALQRINQELDAGTLPDLSTVSVPLLAVVGSRDSAPARRFVDELPAVVPAATTAVVADVGHQWNAEKPELFSTLIRAWLTEQPFPAGVEVRAGT